MGKWHQVEACLPEDREGKHFADRHRCRTPPLFILAVTVLELGFFVYYSALAAAAPQTSELITSVTSHPAAMTSGPTSDLMTSATTDPTSTTSTVSNPAPQTFSTSDPTPMTSLISNPSSAVRVMSNSASAFSDPASMASVTSDPSSVTSVTSDLSSVTSDPPSVTSVPSDPPSMTSATSHPPAVTSVTPDPPSVTSMTSATSVPRGLPAVVRVSSLGAVPLDSALLYRPDRHWQLWRLVTYMVLHTSWWHLTFNLLVQLAVGWPLEMAHGSARVAAIYLAGVLAGSLGTSVCDAGRQVYLVGASGGVYALLTAHVANVLLNYSSMDLGLQRLMAVLLIAGCDVALAIYHRYSPVLPPIGPAISYAAHLAGGVAGLSLGLVILRNFSPKQRQPLIWWLALSVIIACTLFAVLFNVFYVDRRFQYA